MPANNPDLSPSERLLRDLLVSSMCDDETGVSDVTVEWADNKGRRWRRSVGDVAPKMVLST